MAVFELALGSVAAIALAGPDFELVLVAALALARLLLLQPLEDLGLSEL